MTGDNLTEFAKRYAEAWCRRPEKVSAFFAENGSLKVNHGAPAAGRTAIAEIARDFMRDLPDMIVTLDKLEPRGDATAFHWTLIGTNTGPGETGNRVRISSYELWKIGLRDYSSLSEQERVRFVATFMSFLSYTQNAFLKWREGLLKPALWLGWEQVMIRRESSGVVRDRLRNV